MIVKVITNNPKVKFYSLDKGYDTTFIAGSSKEVLSYSRDLILSGWKLAADPLKAYFSRYNPFHTVFLQESFQDDSIAADIIRLEKAILHLDSPEHPKKIDDKTKSDYCDLDYSIATSTMSGLLSNLRYFKPVTISNNHHTLNSNS